MFARAQNQRRSVSRRTGFTMAESLMAIAIAAVSATAMLTSVAAAIQTSTNSINDALGQGLAQQLMDEVASVDFPSGTSTTLGTGTPRSAFRDIDDFAGYLSSPPVDRNGFPIGTEGPGSQPPATRAIWMQPDLNFFSGLTQFLSINFTQGEYLYVLLYIAMVYFFSYFWITVQFNPQDMSKQLKEHGSFIPGLRPGPRTAEYLETVIVRVTYVGAAFLSVIAILPVVVNRAFGVPQTVTQFLGGTGLLIVVSVCMDFLQKVEAQLLMRNYAGFLSEGEEGGPKFHGPRG